MHEEEHMSDPSNGGVSEKSKCYAPVFTANNAFACFFLAIYIAIVVALLIIATLGLIFLSAKGRCLIKGLLYRSKYCTTGNSNPTLEI
jgi:hypothetical protein